MVRREGEMRDERDRDRERERQRERQRQRQRERQRQRQRQRERQREREREHPPGPMLIPTLVAEARPEQKPRWVSTTPFGLPVVPEV